MNWMDRFSQTDKYIAIVRCKIGRLLFADDLVLRISSQSGIQHALNGFVAACDIAGIISKTEAVHLPRNSVQGSLQLGSK